MKNSKYLRLLCFKEFHKFPKKYGFPRKLGIAEQFVFEFSARTHQQFAVRKLFLFSGYHRIIIQILK